MTRQTTLNKDRRDLVLEIHSRHQEQKRDNHQINLLTPGRGRGATGMDPFQSTFSGKIRSCELSAWSQVTSRPVYADIRPIIASKVLVAMRSPLLIGWPLRMDWNIISCSY